MLSKKIFAADKTLPLPLEIQTRLVLVSRFEKPVQMAGTGSVNQEMFAHADLIRSGYDDLKRSDDFKFFMNYPAIDNACEALIILITLLNRMEGVRTSDSCQGLYHGKISPLAPHISFIIDTEHANMSRESTVSVLAKISRLLGMWTQTYYRWSLQIGPHPVTVLTLTPQSDTCWDTLGFTITTDGLERDPDLFPKKNTGERYPSLEISPVVKERVRLDLNTLALSFLWDCIE